MSLFAVFDDAVVTLVNNGSEKSLLFVQKQRVVPSLTRPLPYEALFANDGLITVPTQLGIIQSIYSFDVNSNDSHYQKRWVGLLLLSTTGELYYHGKHCPLYFAIDHVAELYFKVEIPNDEKIISIIVDEDRMALLTQAGNIFINYWLNERLKGGAKNFDFFKKSLSTRGTHPYYELPRITAAKPVSISFSREQLLVITSDAVNNVLLLKVSCDDQLSSTPKPFLPDLNINFSDHAKYSAQQIFSNGTQRLIEVSWVRLKFSHAAKKSIKITAIHAVPYQVWFQSRAGEIFDLETRKIINQVSAQRMVSNGSIHYVIGEDNIVRLLNLTKHFSSPTSIPSWAPLTDAAFLSNSGPTNAHIQRLPNIARPDVPVHVGPPEWLDSSVAQPREERVLDCKIFAPADANAEVPDLDESREETSEAEFAQVSHAKTLRRREKNITEAVGIIPVVYESQLTDTTLRITNKILDCTLTAQGKLLTLEQDETHTAYIALYEVIADRIHVIPYQAFSGYKLFESSVNDLETNSRTMVCWLDGAIALLQDDTTIRYFPSGVRPSGAAAQAYVELRLPANAGQDKINKLFAHHAKEPSGSRWRSAIERKLLLVLTATNKLFVGSEHLVGEKRAQHREWIWESIEFPMPIQISDVGIYEQALIILAEGNDIYLNGAALQLYFKLPTDDVRKNIFPCTIPPECRQIVQGTISAKIVLGLHSFYILRSDGSVIAWRRTICGKVPDQASKHWFVVSFAAEHSVTIKDIQRNDDYVYFQAENNVLYSFNAEKNRAEIVPNFCAAAPHITYRLLVCPKLPPLYVDEQINFRSLWPVHLVQTVADIKKKMGTLNLKIVEVAVVFGIIMLQVITDNEQIYLVSWEISCEPSLERGIGRVRLNLLGIKQVT